jgi:glutamyl-Q tRNA(Asp) synthetase
VYLQRLLGLSEPNYAHVPVLTESNGAKLAKSRRSLYVSADCPLPQLLSVFSLLGLAPPPELALASIHETWRWAMAKWRIENVPRRLSVRVND